MLLLPSEYSSPPGTLSALLRLHYTFPVPDLCGLSRASGGLTRGLRAWPRRRDSGAETYRHSLCHLDSSSLQNHGSSTPLIASTALSCMPGSTWELVSRDIVILAWPSISRTILR